MTRKTQPGATLSADDVRHLCGDIPDWKIARIIASDATYEDLEAVVAWAEGESDVMGEARLPLTGRAAYLLEILTAEEDLWENDRR